MIYMHMLILFITIRLYILLKVSIAKIKKRRCTMYNFLFEMLLLNETKHNKVYCVILKILEDTG